MHLSRPHRRVLGAVATLAAVATVAFVVHPASASLTDHAQADGRAYVYRVAAPDEPAAQRLIQGGFDVLEQRSGPDLFVLGDASTETALRKAGFAPSDRQQLPDIAPKAETLDAEQARILPALDEQTYAGGYHTLAAQYAHLDAIAQQHPDLATVVDYGDSYLKTTNAGSGHDLKAICITQHKSGDCALRPDVAKPRFLLMAQVHAREITTGDMAWRFIDHLVGDAADNAVAKLLASTEVWVIPIANPDGVDVVERGGSQPYLQRKNVHGSGCANPPTASNQAGVDLNRNTATHWNTTGVDSGKCAQAYPGASANSEPETQAYERLLRNLFADQRGSGDAAAAPAGTKGLVLSLHSHAGMVLFPWGATTAHTGNDAKLRAIAAKIAGYSGYQYGQPGELLYNASGDTGDWAYDDLGVASFTIELNACGSFTPTYSCTASDYAKNLPALMYAADKAAAPYA